MRNILFLFLFLISYFPLSEVSGAIVGEIEINGLYSIEKKELLDLLDIRPDKPIDSRGVRQGIKRACLKGIFEDISIETTDGEKVIINVRERDFIEKIYIDGDYGLSRRIIKRNFPLREGQVMRYDMIEAAIEELRHEIAKRGFPHADINVKIERLKKPYRINIHLQVNTGEPERIKKIIVSEVAEEIEKMMSLSEGDIYDQVKLKKDLEKIKTYYKDKGYFRPVVGPYTFADGTLNVPVNPGKHLIISIEGNSAISTRTLLKEMPFFEAEDFRDDIVEEAVYRMLSIYHKKGYPFAQIAPVITSKDDLIGLNFFIFEGAKVKIREIYFNGVSLPEKNLKEVMSLKEGGLYNPDLIDTDREAIKGFYNALGYLEAGVEEFQTRYEDSSKEIDILIRIHEGLKTEIEKVEIVGIALVAEEEVRKAVRIKPGDPYNEVDILDARYRIIELCNTHGLSDVIVSIERNFEGQKASITFQINEGDLIFFGKTIVTGNYRTRYEVVKRELKHHEGMPFDWGILGKERRRLYKLGLFTGVDMEVLDRYNHERDVLIRLNEGNAGAVEVGVGYGDYERFRGFLDLSYRNLWGMNRQASLRLELSSLEKRYILQYHEPWFLSKELSFRAFLLREDRKEINIDTRETRYRLTRYGATAGLEKRLSDTLKAELYYDFSLVETFDVKPDVILSREDTGTLTISGLRPGIVYDTRDNPFDPKKGVLSGISLKFTSPAFLSETNFVKLLFHGSTYHQVDKRFVLALSLRGGVAQGYHKTEELPIVERFFLGGRTTVRGYEQDTLGPKGVDGTPTGGNAFLLGNIELRSYLSKGIGIVAFIDGGNVWLKAKDIDPGNLKYTAGLGFRYNTPVGPIRIDYGRKLQRELGESRGEIHFSIGHAF
ncbi:MAG: outer membrane protein assembly factor BamA [Thermodesulfovibrionales bacterium]|nr:outer membrane protein assembly factor BamA [Thermodesulfovibrionales bacterium]